MEKGFRILVCHLVFKIQKTDQVVFFFPRGSEKGEGGNYLECSEKYKFLELKKSKYFSVPFVGSIVFGFCLKVHKVLKIILCLKIFQVDLLKSHGELHWNSESCICVDR